MGFSLKEDPGPILCQGDGDIRILSEVIIVLKGELPQKAIKVFLYLNIFGIIRLVDHLVGIVPQIVELISVEAVEGQLEISGSY
jgi:hypothetical protein